MSQPESSTVNIHDAPTKTRGFSVMKAGATAMSPGGGGRLRRGLAILDFGLRIGGIIAALAAAITMGTTNPTLNFFTQFFQFRARYYDLPAFSFFVAANAIAYLVLSMPFSLVSIIRPQATAVKFLLLVLDTVMVALTTAGAGAAAAIVYLAHQDKLGSHLSTIRKLCQRVSGAVVASFIAAVIMMILVILSAASLKQRHYMAQLGFT